MMMNETTNLIMPNNNNPKGHTVTASDAIYIQLRYAERAELTRRYGLTTIYNRYTAISAHDAHRLIADSLTAAGDALRTYGYPDYHFSDDDTDYLNAIRDQVNSLTDLMLEEDDATRIERLLYILNYMRADDADADYFAEGFIFGYADHSSPISSLVLENLIN